MISKSVLIIEDHPETARLLQTLFVRYGWKPELSDTLAAGIHRADTHPFPEVILTDLTLPDSTIKETIARLPELMKHGPVVVHSATNDHTVVDAVRAQGAIFLEKDFGSDGAQRLSQALMDAVDAWAGMSMSKRRDVSKVETGLLNLAVTDFAIRAHG